MTLSEAYRYIQDHGVPSGMTGVTGAMAVKCFRAMVNGDHVGLLDGSRRCHHPPHGRREQHRSHSEGHYHPWRADDPNDAVAAIMAAWSKT